MSRYLRLSLIVLMCGGVAAAQQAPEPPPDTGQQPGVTFRAETNFVEVHAIVTDGTGAFVRDLAPEDFEIYEDGVRVEPSVFTLVDLPFEQPFTPVNATAPIDPDVRSTTRTFDGRIYVILLDDLHTHVARTAQVRETAKRFVETYLGADDLAAVVYTSGRQESGQELTGNRRLLIEAIERFQGQKLPSAGAERLAVHLRQVANNEFASDESQGIRTNEGLQAAREVRDPYDQQRALNARRAMQAIGNVSNWLRDVQGRRKALLFFSEGLDYDVYQPFDIAREGSGILADVQEATAAAQRANVNVYGIDPRGMSQFGEMVQISGRSDYPQLEYGTFRGQLRELLLAQESLISISEETGGIPIVNAADLAGGLGRIVLDNSRYYMLGYYSDSSKWRRNRFLKIEVRVRRPGLEVRARKGYLPPDPREMEASREAEAAEGTSAALRAALSKPVPVGDMPFRAFAAPLKGSGDEGSVLVALEIDGSSLHFQEQNGRYAESVEVSIVAVDQRARVQGGDRQSFDLNLMPETYERIRGSGIRLLSRLDLPPGRYQIRVGAYEASGGTAGTLPYDVVVPDYRSVTFDLSGIVMTSSAAEAYATANPDEAALDGALPGPPVVRRVFSPAETIAWYAEVYDRSSRAPHAIAYTTTVEEATTGRRVFESTDRREVDGSRALQAHGFRSELPLRGLAPGRYLLRVDAASSIGGHTARREVLFEIM